MFNRFFGSRYFNQYFKTRPRIATRRTVARFTRVLAPGTRAIAKVRTGNFQKVLTAEVELVKIKIIVRSISAIAETKTFKNKTTILTHLPKVRIFMNNFITGSTVTIFIQFFDYFNKLVFPQSVTIEIYNSTSTHVATMTRSTVDPSVFVYEFDTTNKSGNYCYYIKSNSPQGVSQGKFFVESKIAP